MSRVNLLTGLVAVLLLAPKGPLNAGEIAGFDEEEAQRLVDAKEASYELGYDVVFDVDDDMAAAEAQRLADEAAAVEEKRVSDEAAAVEAKRIADEAAAVEAKRQAAAAAKTSAPNTSKRKG